MRDDEVSREGIGMRTHSVRLVDLPLDDRMRLRLARAIARALAKPAHAKPTLRKTSIEAARMLRVQGFTNEGITARLALLTQSIALENHRGATSLITGKPRWQEVSESLAEWVRIDASD